MSESNKIICPTCEAENPQGKKFCMKCGGSLQQEEKHTDKCPECGADCTEGAMFCGECGYKLEVKEPEPVPEPEPESSTVICPSCSAENSRGKKFCMKCGALLTAASTESAADKPAVKREVKSNPSKAKAKPVKRMRKQSGENGKKFSPKLLVIIAAAVIVVAGAVVGFIVYNNSNGVEYDYRSLGFNYHIKATEKKKFSDTSAKFTKKYNDTAVSILKAAYEYIDNIPIEERFSYLGLSDEAYEILSQTTNQEKLTEIEKWRSNTNTGHYGTFFSGDVDEQMGKYICENSKNYTNVPDNELYFLVIWTNGSLTCFVGSEDNIKNIYGDKSLMSGKMGAAVTSSTENIPLIADEEVALEFTAIAYDFDDGSDLEWGNMS